MKKSYVKPGRKCSEKLNEALRSYKKGDYRKALHLCNKIYSDDACFLDNLLLLSATNFQLQKWDVAAFYSKQCLAVESSCAEAYNIIGCCFKRQGNIEAAFSAFMTATKIKPRLVEAYSNLALAYFDVGAIQDSLGSLEVALSLDERNINSLSNMGILQFFAGDTDSSIKFLLQCLNESPYFSIAWYNIGKVYCSVGNNDLAEEAYQKAIDISNQTFPDALLNLANIFARRSLVDGDQNTMNQAVDMYKQQMKFSLSVLNLGVLEAIYAINLAKNFMHLNIMRRNIHAEPGTVKRLNNLGILYLLIDDGVNAAKYFFKAITIDTTEAYAWNNLGCALILRRKYIDALFSFSIAHSYNRDFIEARINLSRICSEMGFMQKAISNCENCVSPEKIYFEVSSLSENARLNLGNGEVLMAPLN